MLGHSYGLALWQEVHPPFMLIPPGPRISCQNPLQLPRFAKGGQQFPALIWP